MKAKAQEARAKVIEAEAEVPKAMAEAFRSGNLGIMDYYRMKNIEADTSMRENIAKRQQDNAGNQPLSQIIVHKRRNPISFQSQDVLSFSMEKERDFF